MTTQQESVTSRGVPEVENTTEDQMTSSAMEHDWTYFRDTVTKETTRLNNLCDTWEAIFAGNGGFSEDSKSWRLLSVLIMNLG
jgi:shikimate kinase